LRRRRRGGKAGGCAEHRERSALTEQSHREFLPIAVRQSASGGWHGICCYAASLSGTHRSASAQALQSCQNPMMARLLSPGVKNSQFGKAAHCLRILP
jgi:hypothetical protein